MLDAHANLEGKITASFTGYSHEAVLSQLTESVAYFRPALPKDKPRQLLDLFESYPCESGKK